MKYVQVPVDFWADRRLRNADAETVRVACYSRFNKHASSEGIYNLQLGYMALDLGISDLTAVEAIDKLSGWYLLYDNDAEVMFVRGVLKAAAPKTYKQMKGAIRVLESLNETPLLKAFYNEACLYADHPIATPKSHKDVELTFPDLIREAFPGIEESHSNDIPMPSDTHSSENWGGDAKPQVERDSNAIAIPSVSPGERARQLESELGSSEIENELGEHRSLSAEYVASSFGAEVLNQSQAQAVHRQYGEPS